MVQTDVPQSMIGSLSELAMRTRELPIIMVASRGGEHDKILALESGADDYIMKPFKPEHVIAAARKLTGIAA